MRITPCVSNDTDCGSHINRMNEARTFNGNSISGVSVLRALETMSGDTQWAQNVHFDSSECYTAVEV